MRNLYMGPVGSRASQVELLVKNPPANAGNIRDVGLIPVSGRSCGGGHGDPVQYSCLGSPTDRGAWRATLHGVAQSQTRLRGFAHTVSLVVTGGIFNLLLVGPGSLTRDGIWAPALRARSLSHRTTREVLPCSFSRNISSSFWFTF